MVPVQSRNTKTKNLDDSDDDEVPLNQRRKKSTDEEAANGEKKEEDGDSEEDKPLGQRRKKSTDEKEDAKGEEGGEEGKANGETPRKTLRKGRCGVCSGCKRSSIKFFFANVHILSPQGRLRQMSKLSGQTKVWRSRSSEASLPGESLSM